MGSPSFLSSPFFNMGFLLVSMQLAKKIDWEDPNVLLYARIGYFSAQVLVILSAYGLITFINKKNDTTVLTYDEPVKTGLGAAPATGAPVTVSTTIRDYDVEQMKQFIKSTATSIIIISIMHFQFKFTQPLLMQSINPIKGLLTHKVALIHLWGDAPTGNLARPFVAENPLGALGSLFGQGAATEAAPVTEGTANASVDDHAHKD